MKKKFLLLGLLAFVAFFISSCSQEDVVNDTNGASPESVKVEKMTNLFKTYNWNLDTTIPEKERNKLILQMDYDKVKEFLENLNKGIKFEKKDTLVGEVKAKASKTRGITERDLCKTYHPLNSHLYTLRRMNIFDQKMPLEVTF